MFHIEGLSVVGRSSGLGGGQESSLSKDWGGYAFYVKRDLSDAQTVCRYHYRSDYLSLRSFQCI
jgi:hypothetical protein